MYLKIENRQALVQWSYFMMIGLALSFTSLSAAASRLVDVDSFPPPAPDNSAACVISAERENFRPLCEAIERNEAAATIPAWSSHALSTLTPLPGKETGLPGARKPL